MTLRVGFNDASSTFAGAIGASWDANWRGITITKIGTGTLTLNGNSTYIGGTTVSQGTLAVTNSSALGSGVLTMDGGTLNTSANLANNITLNNTANTIAPNGNYRLLSGRIGGPGGFTVAGGGGTPGLEINNPLNDFQRNVTINAGTYLRLTASEVLPNTANITNNGNLRTDVAGGGTETIAGLSGSGSVWVPLGNNNPRLRGDLTLASQGWKTTLLERECVNVLLHEVQLDLAGLTERCRDERRPGPVPVGILAGGWSLPAGTKRRPPRSNWCCACAGSLVGRSRLPSGHLRWKRCCPRSGRRWNR